MFYKSVKRGREYWCSVCGEHFFVDYIRRFDDGSCDDALDGKHNEKAHCPHCGASVILKNTGKAKGCKNLTQWGKFVVVKPVKADLVYLICFWAHKDYHTFGYTTTPIIHEAEAIYRLTPGKAEIIKGTYPYSKAKKIIEPFHHNSFGVNSYYLIAAERLSGTFLKYCRLDEFKLSYRRNRADYYGYMSVPICKYLCRFAEHPQIEMLMKAGLEYLVEELVDGRPMKRYINWDAETPKEMFKMNGQQLRDMLKNCYSAASFRLYQKIKNQKSANFRLCEELLRKYGIATADRLCSAIKKYKLNLTHTLNYIEKNSRSGSSFDKKTQTVNLWTDYLTFASELKYDLKRGDVIYPKELQKKHDEAAAALVRLNDEKRMQEYESRYKKLCRLYEYDDGTYCIVIPLGINDIVAEGKVLRHCVGGYAARHVDGKTTILFMRKSENKSERLVTIEINDTTKELCQAYGFRDRILTAQERKHLNKWLNWVKAGSRRENTKQNKKSA